jgi:hypothetical protein
LKPVNLRAGHVQFAMVAAWRDAVHAARRAALEPRILQNTDGDPFLMCTDHFDIRCGTGDLLDALETIDGAQVNHTDEHHRRPRRGEREEAARGDELRSPRERPPQADRAGGRGTLAVPPRRTTRRQRPAPEPAAGSAAAPLARSGEAGKRRDDSA